MNSDGKAAVYAGLFTVAFSAIAILWALFLHDLAVPVIIIFIGTYALISSEKVNRTGMSLLGMAIVGVLFWITNLVDPVSQEIMFIDLIYHIEWDTILFVTSMMIIVSVAGGSGMFQYLALNLAKPSEGVHKSLYTIFMLFVFVISLFLDNVSTILIMAPLTIQVCKALDIDFKPFLISESIICNIGSIPSIVGAVPNIVIGNIVMDASPTAFDAGTLFITFMPLCFLLLLVTWVVLTRYYKDKWARTEASRVELLFDIDPAAMIKSKTDFYASVLAFGALILGFALGPTFHITPVMVALLVAASLLVLAHERVGEFLGKVGWDTVFFLVGLFGLVGALNMTGLIDMLGDGLLAIIGDNPVLAIIFMVWVPAILSAFLDNLPVSAVLAPVAVTFAPVSAVLPYVLVFAVNVGGNVFTPLGSPSNMVAIGFSEQEHDPISFKEFAITGTYAGLLHLLFGTLWLLGIEFIGLWVLVGVGIILSVIGFIVILLPHLRVQDEG